MHFTNKAYAFNVMPGYYFLYVTLNVCFKFNFNFKSLIYWLRETVFYARVVIASSNSIVSTRIKWMTHSNSGTHVCSEMIFTDPLILMIIFF